MLAAGRLNQRVTLQAKTVTRGAGGEEVPAWADVATTWAEVEPLRGREFFAAQGAQYACDVKVRMRYRDDIAVGKPLILHAGDWRELRILWRSQPHDVTSVIEVRGGREALELLCIAGVKDGR